ncbi:MAG: hypothetical protein JWO96_853 [Candidatus Saccharibacteria bacterium]|nr:hypothetical protein [Candidatus Saccharibacteria bacterium]
MANNTDKDKTVTDNTDKRVEKEPFYHTSLSRRNWLVPALLVVIVILLAGMFASHRERQGVNGLPGRGQGLMTRHERRFLGQGLPGSNQNQLSGTVTAVNGSTFTIAGNGASNQVQTSSSTQYQGGNQVKINDTVVVFGTTSSGTFQASQVVINP